MIASNLSPMARVMTTDSRMFSFQPRSSNTATVTTEEGRVMMVNCITGYLLY